MIRAMNYSTGAKSPVSDVRKEETYSIMTMNMNGKSQGKGTADKRRELIISTINSSPRPASVIFCQELPGFFEKKVVANCGTDGNSYKCVRPRDIYSGNYNVAVMWCETDFQGREVDLTDSSLFTKIVKSLIKEEKLDLGLIMASIRSAMVKLTSRETEASFLAVSWHGPWKVKTASKKSKFEVFCGLICLLRVVCEKEELSSFIIGGDFNFNTSEVDRLAEYGVTIPQYDSFVPDKDTFIFSNLSDKLPMTVDITVSSVAPLELENESGQSALLDHVPVVGDLLVYKKPSIKQDRDAVKPTNEKDRQVLTPEATERRAKAGPRVPYAPRRLTYLNDRGSFGSLQHALPKIAVPGYDGEDDDIKRKLQQELLPRNPELEEVAPRKGQRKNGKPDMKLRENRQALGLQNIDGTPDMRFKINKETFGNKASLASLQTSNPAPRSSYIAGLVKRDGNPHMGYAVKKQSASPSPSYRGSLLPPLSPYSTHTSGLVKLSSNSTNSQLPSGGSYRCGKNSCPTCLYITHGLTTYTFFSTPETRRPIKDYMTCHTRNLIYMIQCNLCELQYIGQTGRSLKEGFYDHLYPIDNRHSNPKSAVAKHFLSGSPNHKDYMQLIPIEKMFSKIDSHRRDRKADLIREGGTIHPNGLNIRKR